MNEGEEFEIAPPPPIGRNPRDTRSKAPKPSCDALDVEVAGKRLAPLRRGRAVSPPEAPKWSMGEPGMVPEIHHVRMQRYGG
jgi:hypothetical protein